MFSDGMEGANSFRMSALVLAGSQQSLPEDTTETGSAQKGADCLEPELETM